HSRNRDNGCVRHRPAHIRHQRCTDRGYGVTAMNEFEFKRHLKDLAHGHHHPEEHDWGRPAAKPAHFKGRAARRPRPKGRRRT
ncbi:MAG TPA: hypothetical protein VGS58_16160, partial [Candidatus Sulfopaludibacter sp.]|nr:hypothetical protein [Candidatus Sulfopaludibacter sp.]